MKNYYKYCVYIKYIIVVGVVLICGGIYGWTRYHNSHQVKTRTLNVADDSSIQKESDNNAQQKQADEGITESGQDRSGNIKSDKGQNSTVTEQEQTVQQTEQAYVYVCGCVVNPGVYQCASDARIYEVIAQAGGFTDDADRTYLNLVDRISDGQKLVVPAVNENQTSSQTGLTVAAKININTASKEQLMTLPGIGESKANDIIESRNTAGRFEKTEDIMRISGIKESAFKKLKDLISTN